MFLILVGLAACEARGTLVLDPAATGVGSVETIFVGTTRGIDPETGEEFSRVRSHSTRFVRLDVSIPPERTPGEIKWPRTNKRANPQTDFVLIGKDIYPEPSAFRRELAEAIRHERRGDREAVVFVHGFNNNFAEGSYRLAQLGRDLDAGGVLVHYSWPSRANPLGYAYDRDSALFARDGLETLLTEVEAAGAERILIVAHSLGSALTMETLRQIAISGNRRLMSRISGVVLMSPDIDVDVFRAQAARIGTLPRPFIIFTSKRDRALALSARLTGQDNRLGNLTDVETVADLKVTLLDTTAFSTGSGHFDAGNSPALLKMLSRVSDVDSAFSGDQTGRAGLLPGAVLSVQNATQLILLPVTAISGIQP
ncbi:MAG: alpha/beta fold hydrolase [Rhodobacteraceae bacterium]|nr:alpha/beta fold hydrolase [Paracoccaceae bacterium]